MRTRLFLAFSIFALAATAQAQIGGFMFPGPGGPAASSGGAVLPPSGMSVWYSADCITYTSSVCGTPSNGSTITSWADRSGNANNLTSTGGTSTFNTSQINGLPAVTFSSSKWSLSTGIGAGASRTQIVVVKPTSASGGATFGGAAGAFTYYFQLGNPQIIVASSCIGGQSNATTTLTSAWHQVNVRYTYGTSVTFRMDRAADATLANSNGSPTADSVIGYNGCNASEFFAGQIAEMLYYPSVLSSTDITQVEAYLNSKYGL